MYIVKPPDFLSVLKDHHLLLDTNVFIDTLLYPRKFRDLFNEIKDNNGTLVTLKVVLAEFTRGASTEKKFTEKKKLIEQIIDTYLPVKEDTCDYLVKLVLKCKEDGKTISITDFMLGAFLMQYQNNLLLLTRNINDFPTNIFTLKTYFHLFYIRAIHNYGIYSFDKKAK